MRTIMTTTSVTTHTSPPWAATSPRRVRRAMPRRTLSAGTADLQSKQMRIITRCRASSHQFARLTASSPRWVATRRRRLRTPRTGTAIRAHLRPSLSKRKRIITRRVAFSRPFARLTVRVTLKDRLTRSRTRSQSHRHYRRRFLR
jgi:hypothetical protein